MTSKPLRILLVSVGGYGRRYLAELTEKPIDGELVGIVDIAKGLDQTYPVISTRNIPVYSNLESFYASDQADLAVICSPIHLHTQMVSTALAHGSHVLCEKPLCADEGDTARLSALAKENGYILAVGWQLNYDRTVWQVKQSILDGQFGAPLRGRCIHAMRRGRNYYTRNNWSGRIAVDGLPVLDSPFMNGCAHNFQLMTFLLGKDMQSARDIVKVEGELYRANQTLENYDIAALRCFTEQNVPLLYLTAHPLAAKNLGQSAEIEFEQGFLTWGRGKPYRFDYHDGRESVVFGKGAENGMSLQKLYDVIDCIRTGTHPYCLAETGLPHLHAVQMAQKLPIQPIDPANIEYMESEDDRFLFALDVESVLMDAYLAYALPGEIGLHL